jgi:hypothetical protein
VIPAALFPSDRGGGGPVPRYDVRRDAELAAVLASRDVARGSGAESARFAVTNDNTYNSIVTDRQAAV